MNCMCIMFLPNSLLVEVVVVVIVVVATTTASWLRHQRWTFLLFSWVNNAHLHPQKTMMPSTCATNSKHCHMSPMQGSSMWSSHTQHVTHLRWASHWSPLCHYAPSLAAVEPCLYDATTRLQSPLVFIEFTVCLDIIPSIVFNIRIFHFLLISDWLIL